MTGVLEPPYDQELAGNNRVAAAPSLSSKHSQKPTRSTSNSSAPHRRLLPAVDMEARYYPSGFSLIADRTPSKSPASPASRDEGGVVMAILA
ncbi:hypothetical protein MUK42_27244 [Musa troglodytarum]|uniref:Uncharacterized protein n=1 Tax=Musa troglodytarum TaxID=320322 RepID=A0A9E7EYZ4_9LILI|nr:hypothetical protein MUK42_27244 [Musa troglodytarum]